MTFRAAGATDVGTQRDVNEDRFYSDPERGIFTVIDGVGGQAAGGRAADTALDVIRTRLASAPTTNGALAYRIREAITLANNEVYRQASSRPEWHGMACVLTAVIIEDDRAIVGHVGDTRLYKLRAGKIQKMTPDHSPVGEREDAGELSETDAMRHPRRNEVYRDVGSELHEIGDTDFVDVRGTTMEPDAALLLCSDGLTDLVASDEIQRVVQQHKGKPDDVTRALVKAANDAGGKDNITVVYVEGERFADARVPGAASRTGGIYSRSQKAVAGVLLMLMGLAGLWAYVGYPIPDAIANALISNPAGAGVIVVNSGGSIAAAIERSAPGTTILVEPGEYRERLTLKSHIRLHSVTPRAAVLRLPGSATDEDAAVVATDVSNVEISGFRIVGDAATPLGTGVIARSAQVRLIDLEITGAARVAVDLGTGEGMMLLGSDIHDNSGAGLALRAGASPRITHSTFSNNGGSEQAMLIEPGAQPVFVGNFFHSLDPLSFSALDPAARLQLRNVNWFPDARPAPAAGRRGR
jgi:serine/threonine protein phosphatase PrpC